MIGWATFVQVRKEFWDRRVQDLCAKEGGITIYETVTLRDRRYLDRDLNVRIPPILERATGYGPMDFEAKPDDIFFRTSTLTILREDRPRVAKSDVLVFRTSDKKVLGRATTFGRVGADLLAIDFESRLTCPDGASESDLFKRLFVIQLEPDEKP